MWRKITKKDEEEKKEGRMETPVDKIENSMCVTQYGGNEVWTQTMEENREAVGNENNGKWA